MKRPLVILLIVGVIISLFILQKTTAINADFATSAALKYHYCEDKIDATISMEDLKSLKEILKGRSFSDNPSCGFDISEFAQPR